ncbi:MAG: transglutaminase-like domain-containing protein [Gemmatimonadota bacterium]|nr:transglutaminase-like domain-containing protein [Gemmatimonadota bacterium]MDH3366370.1 transglutaminase-like domain-containing protein [Gemmatimonadota bacterium]MDH3477628.1 transglutaminase-like domain-containing protein [Gemmatimonadota bacterium]MDH5549993.1 transglutaminase-like domain-containing protein [Gemmatimonadota bacterium]
MRRRVGAVAVLLVWIGVMGWLVKREYFRPQAELLAEAGLSVSPAATFYRLDLGGQQIGFASSLVDTLQDTIRVQDQMVLRIPALGSLQRVEARTSANLTRTLRLRSFDATLRGQDVRFGVVGRVTGDSVLDVEIQSADSKQTYRIPLERPIVLPALLPLKLAFGGNLGVGRTYSMRLFDPLTLAERDVNITVTAESTFIVPDSAELSGAEPVWIAARWDTVHAWKVKQEMGGFSVEAWIDDVGQIVQATTPVGFAMERTAYEIAFENFMRREPELTVEGVGADLIRATAIASNVALSDAQDSVRVRLTGVDLVAFDLSGGRQTLVGDTLVVVRESEDLLRAQYRLPASGPPFDPYLVSEPLVQSKDPRIQAQARQIVGRTRDPRRAAQLLNDWVHGELAKRVTVSVPSALEVLKTRRGDCNEHTVLYVALARAVGIPARTAAGLVYVDGRFYYHAWPEVYLNGWVAVDPTFGQFPADASHLRFTVGGLARQVELIQLIGRLELEVIQTRSDR